jgi:cell wall-associated NlpC family hydrolase
MIAYVMTLLQKNSKRWLLPVLLIGLQFTACSVYSPPRSSGTITKSASKEDLFRQDVVSTAQKYVGSRYKYAGRDPNGFDCSGFTYFVFRDYDIDLSPSSRAQEKDGRSIPVRAAKTGDLIFFRRSPVGQVFHVALVVSNDQEGLKVIHSTSRGVVVDNITESSYWKPKISSARDVISGRF